MEHTKRWYREHDLCKCGNIKNVGSKQCRACFVKKGTALSRLRSMKKWRKEKKLV